MVSEVLHDPLDSVILESVSKLYRAFPCSCPIALPNASYGLEVLFSYVLPQKTMT